MWYTVASWDHFSSESTMFTSLCLMRFRWQAGAIGRKQPQSCSSSSFRERHFSYSPEFWSESGAPGPKASSRRRICGPSFSLDSLRLERPDAYDSGLLRAGPLWGRAVYIASHSDRLSSVSSGDRSTNSASVPGCGGLQ